MTYGPGGGRRIDSSRLSYGGVRRTVVFIIFVEMAEGEIEDPEARHRLRRQLLTLTITTQCAQP
jgi:hypothetical protein